MFLTNLAHHYQRLWHWTPLSPPVATPLVAHRSPLLISCDDRINRIKERGEEIEIMIDYCYSLFAPLAVHVFDITQAGKQVAIGGTSTGWTIVARKGIETFLYLLG